MHAIRRKKRIRFEEVFSEAPSREEVVTLFLAMLELLRLGQMHIRQEVTYGSIVLLSGRARPSHGKEEQLSIDEPESR